MRQVPGDAALGDPEGAYPVMEAVAARTIAALCAEAVGAMQVMVESTGDIEVHLGEWEFFTEDSGNIWLDFDSRASPPGACPPPPRGRLRNAGRPRSGRPLFGQGPGKKYIALLLSTNRI